MKLVKFCCACAAIALSSSAFSQVDEIKITGTRDSSGSTTTVPTGVYREETRPSDETPGQAKAMLDRNKKVAEETAKAEKKAKQKRYNDCMKNQNEANIPSLLACQQNALGWGFAVSTSCRTGAAVGVGATIWYLAPELTVVAISAGLRVSMSGAVSAVGGLVASCDSWTDSLVNYKSSGCDAERAANTEAVCGPLRPAP